MGESARQRAETARAQKSRYGECLPLFRDLRNLTYTAACFEGSAALALDEGNPERAATLCAHAAELRKTAGTPLPPNEQQAFDATVSSARSALSQNRFAEAWKQGDDFTDEEGMTFAVAGLEGDREEPPPQPDASGSARSREQRSDRVH